MGSARINLWKQGFETMAEKSGETSDPKDTSEQQIKRYVLIELSCDVTSCRPCTYPNCQRFRRNEDLQGLGAKSKPKINKVTELESDGTVKE